jgi:hypothetical protein
MLGTALSSIITGFVPMIPIQEAQSLSDRDGRDKPGHDNGGKLERLF